MTNAPKPNPDGRTYTVTWPGCVVMIVIVAIFGGFIYVVFLRDLTLERFCGANVGFVCAIGAALAGAGWRYLTRKSAVE